jgi:hypothetical protein
MALVALYPAAGETVDDEFGDPIDPADGVRVTIPSPYYDPLILQGRLLRGDPLTTNIRPIYTPSGGDPYTTYVVPGNAVVGDGVTNDRAALNTLANTTISASGGTITFAPGTYLVNSAMSFPRNVQLVFQAGALLKPAASVSVSILGSIDAPALSRIFDCTASGAKVLIPGGTVYPEWWGAKADGTMSALPGETDNRAAIISAVTALESAGGIVEFSDERGIYNISDRMVFGQFFAKITVRGRSINTRIRHTSATAFGAAGSDSGLFTFNGLNLGTSADRITFRDIRISGFSTTDYVEILRFNFATEMYCENVYIDTNGLEGMASINTDAAREWNVRNCRAEYIGAGVYSLSAYNLNANKVSLIGCIAKHCGVGVEQTGQGFVCIGNQFYYTTERCLQISSTTYVNEDIIVQGNIIYNAEQGIVTQDVDDSIGRTLIQNNLLVDCANGIIVSAGGSGNGCFVTDNYLIGGSQGGGAIIIQGAGRHTIVGNHITRTRGTVLSTDSVGGGPAGMSIPAGSAVLTAPRLTGITEGTRITIPALDGGTPHEVLSKQFSLGSQQLLATLDYTHPGAAIVSATGAYYSEPWAYGIDVQVDDYHVIRDNVISGDCWTTVAILLRGGFKAKISGNVFQQNGTANPLALLAIGTSQSWSSLSGTTCDQDTPFTYSILGKSYVRRTGEPTALTWKTGDEQEELAPVAGGTGRRKCVTAGTANIINPTGGSTTGNITSGTNSLVVASAAGILLGCGVSITGVSGFFRVTAIAGTTITLDRNADATVTGNTVNFSTTTGSITSGTASLTVSSAFGLYAGAYITIQGVTGVKLITAISGTTVTIDSNASATVATAAVAFSQPVWKVSETLAA